MSTKGKLNKRALGNKKTQSAKRDVRAKVVTDELDLKTEKTNAHSGDIDSVAFSPDGTKIVSGSRDKTIKVWDSGAFWAPNRPSLARADDSWLPVQPHWS